MRHRRLGLLVAVMLVAGACSSSTSTTAPTSAASAAPPTAAASAGASASAAASACNGVTLTLATIQDPVSDGVKALAPVWEQKTGGKFSIVESPYADLYSKLVTAFQANDSTYDLALLDDPWMPKFGTMSALADLGALGIQKDPDIAQIVWDVGTWPPPSGPVPPSETGKPQQLLAVTNTGNVQMFMWRKDIVPDAPKTYTDVLNNGKAQNKPDFAGYLIRGKATNPVVADFLPILWSFGGDVFDQNWNVVFNSDKSLAAVKFLVEDLKAIGQADPASSDAGDRDRLMAIGQGFQSSFWPGEVSNVLGEGSTVVGKVGFAPIPGGPDGTPGAGMMGNWMLAIPKASKNQECAADFIKLTLLKESQLTAANAGGIPSRTSVLKDASLADKYPQYAVLADALQAPPKWRPRTDQWNQVETILGTHLNAALAGGESAQDVVTKASDEIRTLMQGAGYPTQ